MESQHGTSPVRLTAEPREDAWVEVLVNKLCCWVCPCLRCQQCLQLTSSTHLSEQEGAAGSQQAEVKLNPRISQIKKLSLYSMDQRNSCAAGSCNSSVPHWISLGGKTEPALNEVFLILPMSPFPGLR